MTQRRGTPRTPRKSARNGSRTGAQGPGGTPPGLAGTSRKGAPAAPSRRELSRLALSTEHLRKFELLHRVAPERIEQIASESRVRWLEPGEVLLRSGQVNRELYLVLSGAMTVHLTAPDSQAIAVIRPGESVGELSVLDQKPVSAFAVAKEQTCVLVISEDRFWTLLETSHAFAVNLLLKLTDRLRSNNERVSENVRLREKYERAAMFDPLTNLHNRRWLQGHLPRLIGRYAQAGRPVSVAIADIDYFKRVNDRLGHEAGDAVLVAVADTLQKGVRETDVVARFGGEEFVIVLPDTPLREAVKIAERLRHAVSETEVRIPEGTPVPKISLSIGVAELEKGADAATVLRAADGALYRAKQGGRDRCVAHAKGST